MVKFENIVLIIKLYFILQIKILKNYKFKDIQIYLRISQNLKIEYKNYKHI